MEDYGLQNREGMTTDERKIEVVTADEHSRV